MLRLQPSEITLSQRDVDEAFARAHERRLASRDHSARPQPRPRPYKPPAELPRLRRGPGRSTKESIVVPSPVESIWQSVVPHSTEISSDEASGNSKLTTSAPIPAGALSGGRTAARPRACSPADGSDHDPAAENEVACADDLFRVSGFEHQSGTESTKRHINTDGASDYSGSFMGAYPRVLPGNQLLAQLPNAYGASQLPLVPFASHRIPHGGRYMATAAKLHNYGPSHVVDTQQHPEMRGGHVTLSRNHHSRNYRDRARSTKRVNRHVSDNMLEFNSLQHQQSRPLQRSGQPSPKDTSFPAGPSSSHQHAQPQPDHSHDPPMIPSQMTRARSEEILGHPSNWSRHGRQVYHALAIEAAVRNFPSPLALLERRFTREMASAPSMNTLHGPYGHERRSMSQQLLLAPAHDTGHGQVVQRPRAMSAGSRSIAKVQQDAEQLCAGFSDSTADLNFSFSFPPSDQQTLDDPGFTLPSQAPATAANTQPPSTASSLVAVDHAPSNFHMRSLEHAIRDIVAQECLIVSEQFNPNPIEQRERTRTSMDERRSLELSSLRQQRHLLEAELHDLQHTGNRQRSSVPTPHRAVPRGRVTSPRDDRPPPSRDPSQARQFNSSPPLYHPSPRRALTISPSISPPLDDHPDFDDLPQQTYQHRQQQPRARRNRTPPPPSLRPRHSLPTHPHSREEHQGNPRYRDPHVQGRMRQRGGGSERGRGGGHAGRGAQSSQIEQENDTVWEERAMMRELRGREMRMGRGAGRGDGRGVRGEDDLLDETPPRMGRFERMMG